MTYLVGSRSRFVLVEASDAGQARERGHDVLCALYRQICSQPVTVEIVTVRPATADEIRLLNTQHAPSQMG